MRLVIPDPTTNPEQKGANSPILQQYLALRPHLKAVPDVEGVASELVSSRHVPTMTSPGDDDSVRCRAKSSVLGSGSIVLFQNNFVVL